MSVRQSPVWHPFTQMKGVDSFPKVLSGKGSYLQLENGDTLIDAISSWWVITHGHCDPAIVEAIAKQAARLDQVIFAGFTHPGAEALAEALIAMTPEPLSKVFFSDDGSTAVEVALKMALQASIQRGHTRRNKFLAFESAYHGDTLGAMSVGDRSVFTGVFEPLMFDVIRARHPSHSSAGPDAFLADFREKLDRYETELAAVIVEPLIQGAGGMIVWPEAAVVEIAKACKARGISLIFDEVMTGFGRTGARFAMEKLAVQPDLVCLSKGLTGGTLPLSVTLASEEIYNAFLSDDRGKTFFHGHSFTANPISCAAALANLNLMKQRDMPGLWAGIEAIHRDRMKALESHPAISDRRICGTVAAVEIKDTTSNYLSPMGPRMYRHALKNGVLLRPLGNVLYIMPPYGTSSEDLHRIWDVFESCIEIASR